jgi:TIR domain-containing protein
MPARDVFLCHARGDRFTHTGLLADALNRRVISCWVDEGEILPGHSLTDAINDGIRTSRYIILLVTAEFLKAGWRQAELKAALSREIRTNKTIVIPVIDISHDEFAEQYPLLGDKLAIDWSEGVGQVADQVARLFRRDPAEEWHCNHPEEFVGPVWVRVGPLPEQIGKPHILVLRWGPYIKRHAFTPEVPVPTSFLHHKTAPDNITLHATISPAAVVTFGQGSPPDRQAVNIDEGWVRSAGGQ